MGLRAALYAAWVAYGLLFWSCVLPWLQWSPPWAGRALLLAWHVCFAAWLWSLGRCAVTAPARAEPAPPPPVAEDATRLRELALALAPHVPVRAADAPRYCSWCRHWQPPRAQHCLLCRTCVARQDHHSRLLGHCVGSRNWKPYFLFLVYGLACCVSAVGWAMLRLCQMGDFVVLGPTEPSVDHSLSVLLCLLLLVTGLCLVLPMFWLTLASMLKAALRNMTAAEQREMAVAVSADPALRTAPWPYCKPSPWANLCEYLGPLWTWWRP